MRIFNKIIIGIVIFLLVGVVGGYFFVNHIANRGITKYDATIKLKHLKDKVVIRRDAHAIPHIIAKNEEDLYRATGYVLAQDRLWQMDLLRRVTTGRLSEIFGKDLSKADHLMRALQIPVKTKAVIEKTDKNILSALEAFADGINQYIENNGSKLPPEFTILGYEPEPWKIEHSVNLIGYMAWDLTMSWGSEISLYKILQKVDSTKFQELIPDMINHKTHIYSKNDNNDSELEIKQELALVNKKIEELGLDIFMGSNNWAVSGKKSTTGKPILANDMHLGLFAPGIWYQAHQYIEGRLNVTGLILPGAPFIIDGHNNDIAWGMTNIMIDDMDFYQETINPDNTNQYLLDGKWVDMKIKREVIKTSEGDTIEKFIKFTHRGPIISQLKNIKGKAISMRWIGNDYSDELKAIYKLNKAKNWDDFKSALRSFTSLGQNIIYADKQGNIGMYTATKIPIREGNPWLIYPGNTRKYDWKAFVEFDSLPHAYNPECGYLASANCKTTDDNYPYYISKWFDLPYRMDRIKEMLEAKEKLSVNDFKQMLGDHKSKLAEEMHTKLVEQISKLKGLNKRQQKAVDIFKNWDGVYTTESVAASIFEYFYICFTKNIVYDELGNELFNDFITQKILVRNLVKKFWDNPQSEWWDNVNTENKKEDFTYIVQKSFTDALDSLKTKYGSIPDNWKWGLMHTLTLKHPLGKVDVLNFAFNLNRGPYQVGGSFHTVSPFAYDFNNLFEVKHGASHKHIFSTANWNNSLTVIPTGISGIPASQYYCDQTEMYLNNEFHNDYFDIMKVSENSKYKMELIPE